MPDINLSRSILINAPAAKVYQSVADLNHWTTWSPWLIMEPEASVNVERGGNYYEWDGHRVGSGNMQVTNQHENNRVDYDLTFLKPWKSEANVRFEVKEKDENTTEATWYMDSKLPFYLFWMKKQMEAWVGMDYERGLRMLKDFAEKDEIESNLLFGDVTVYPGCRYAGIKTECTLDQLGDRMGEDFGRLGQFFDDKKEMIAGDAFAIYHQFDIVKDRAVYTAALPLSDLQADLPVEYATGEIPKTQIKTLTHVGRYEHLGNAWSTLYAMERNKEFKRNKKVDPFEVYRNMPGQVPDKELVTEVNFPVK
ncbi:MAG: SRPBCC family protein [Cyclobacteriaceae bacterium]